MLLEGPGDEWKVDEAATDELRRDVRAARLGHPVFNGGDPNGERVAGDAPFTRVCLSLAVAEHDGGHAFFCTHCRGVVASMEENYKEFSRFEELELSETNPYYPPAKAFVDAAFVARRYFCPHCGVLFDVEVCEPGAPPFRDLVLQLAPTIALEAAVS